jgi:NAD(P)-dependent dehydrogenase (short-subunit alcohol dehydrogenase family)
MITVHEGNIGQSDDCRRVVHEVIDRHGRVDILVNNAASLSTGPWPR